MVNNHDIFRTGFGQQAFEIDCNNEDAYRLAEFLLADLPGAEEAEDTRCYDILSVGTGPMLSLWDNDKLLYFGESRYRLAYILINEIIFHCIEANTRQHALHAGAVHRGDRCVILPGHSGRGKSTLTAWLVANGWQYLTDELVFLANDGSVLPLTRPITLKVNDKHKSWLLHGHHSGSIVTGDSGSMIPHRLFNAAFSVSHPRVTDIIYPEFTEGVRGCFREMSPAKSALYLMQSHVNARNLNGHGIADISTIVRRCRSYRLIYGDFADLDTIFNSPSGLFT